MRGSPLFRTFVILVALAAAGFVFARITSSEEQDVVVEDSSPELNVASETIGAKVYVSLSAPAKSVMLFANADHLRLGESATASYSSAMGISASQPVLYLEVEWSEKADLRRFVKVVVEAEGEDTFTHVFDSMGDIEDFVELPF